MLYRCNRHRTKPEYLELIHQSSKNLLDVLKNTTTLSRATFGEQIPQENLKLEELISELNIGFASYLREVEMELIIDIPDDLVIRANTLISEAFRNYLSNAIKYAPGGKKKIS